MLQEQLLREQAMLLVSDGHLQNLMEDWVWGLAPGTVVVFSRAHQFYELV